MARSTTHLLAFLLPLLALLSFVSAQDVKPAIYKGSDRYIYQGCYNETTDIANTAHERALSGGSSQVLEGTMTVPICLNFCLSGGTNYKYAGIEYSRECWCSQRISGISTKFDDQECNLPCDGNKEMICGGPLKLSVYKLSGAVSVAAGGMWTLVFAAGVASWMLF